MSLHTVAPHLLGTGFTDLLLQTACRLSFLGIVVGMVFAVSYIIFYDNPRFVRLTEQYGGFVPPEHRLPPGMVGAPLLVIGLAWFAATNGPSVHFMASISAGAPFGAGMVLVFLSIQNYLVDSYTVYAASVLAANSVVRSLFGAAFPLFTRYMYQNLGIHVSFAVLAARFFSGQIDG